MLAIVLPTIVAIFAFAYWFRAVEPGRLYLPNWDYSGRIELVVWSIPTLTVILLGGVAWIGSHQLDPASRSREREARSGSRWFRSTGNGCSSIRTSGVATVNALTVPVGAPLHFELTSASVMNVFFIPQLGSMIYTMNGMVTQLESARRPGRRPPGPVGAFQRRWLSGHACSTFTSFPQLDFPDWVARQRKAISVLNADSYKQLAQQSIETGKPTYRLDDPTLFRQIVDPANSARARATTDRQTWRSLASGAADAR